MLAIIATSIALILCVLSIVRLLVDEPIRRFLRVFGFSVSYTCLWGRYTHRYSSLDAHMGRPIHPMMSVAPPWAKLRITRAR